MKTYTNLKKTNWIPIAAVGMLLLLFFGAVIYLLSQAIGKGNTNDSYAFARVGEERIYQKQLNYEISSHPQGANPETQQMLKQKMINDSIILQAAARERIITLDKSFYNNIEMDYLQRMGKVQFVQEEIKNKSAWVKGSVITIWFLNANFIGPLGYEGSKAEALKKITDLYNKVKSEEISMAEAKAAIRADESLENLDRAYYTNAFLDFDTSVNDKVTFDNDFNQAIKRLKTGELTPIIGLKEDSPSPAFKGQTVEVLYAFAKAEEANGGSVDNFDSWLNTHKSQFKVTENK